MHVVPISPEAAGVLRFWFEETTPSKWFARDPAFDALVRGRFFDLTSSALASSLQSWEDRPEEALALVLLLDQFPRQIWRESARAFAGDERALAVCQGAVAKGWVLAEAVPARRRFWLMPLMHSEDLSTQEAGLSLFERCTDPRTFDFARRHRDVIARFGRFPHRNEALGRPSTPEEKAFLEQPGSRF
jgi:uncharacterized protein (DUF924 family)